MKENDFVIATQSVNGIPVDSVGIIKSMLQEAAQVHFVGKNEDIIAPFDSLRVINVEQTGDEYPYKVCNMCHILKPTTEEFAINQYNKKGEPRRRPSCKSCRKIIEGTSITTPEKNRLNAERPSSKTVFECPICGKRTVVDVTAKIVVDHDRGTGTGRKWICDSCNTGLGRFKDNITILKIAIKYLEQFEGNESKD